MNPICIQYSFQNPIANVTINDTLTTSQIMTEFQHLRINALHKEQDSPLTHIQVSPGANKTAVSVVLCSDSHYTFENGFQGHFWGNLKVQ